MDRNSLKAEKLKKTCDPQTFPFQTTDEIEPLREVIGQPRAVHALQLGSKVEGPGFNIFVSGLPDSGRTSLTTEYFQRQAKDEPTPDDWCYVEHFADPRTPRPVRLPPGGGRIFQDQMEDFLARALRGLKDAFQSKQYLDEKKRLSQRLKQKQDQSFQELQERAARDGFQLLRSPLGIKLQPVVNGEPLSEEQRRSLREEEQQELQQKRRHLEKQMQDTASQIRRWDREIHQIRKELDRETAHYVIAPLLAELVADYQGQPAIQDHLSALEDDFLTMIVQQRLAEDEQGLNLAGLKHRYGVNVLIDHGAKEGAPVVMESHPTIDNLVGQIEHRLSQAGSFTNFTLIKPGALHQANGGYLLLPARDLLLNRHAWDTLKRALRDGAIRIQTGRGKGREITAPTLDPQPIPLDVKVILIGTPQLFHHLREKDEDFDKLFKVKAEFATEMDRTPENEHSYGQFIKSVQDRNRLLPFGRSGVARVIEYGSRLAEDQGKLSTRFGKIANLLRESAYWAAVRDAKMVDARDVEKAIQMADFRNNLDEEKTRQKIQHHTIMISVSGEKVGELNALTVLSNGEYEYGSPVRVSAVSRPGDEGVVAIERQAELSGPIHTKGVLILSGFLGERYGQGQPLNLSGSITFEQSYAEVDGDSASAAELLALLSSIGDIPLKQECAITGSINQHGEIQAVGGINEKLEGYYQVCVDKGLTGTQGVIIPETNLHHLMLSDDVIQSVRENKFHIWPIATIDEAIPLLTGLQPGVRDAQGRYPRGSFNDLVQKALKKYHEIHRTQD